MKRALLIAVLLSMSLCSYATEPNELLSSEFVSTFKKAQQGDAEAQCNLGVMYDKGHGVAQDWKEAVKWYQKAAEQGSAESQYALGVMYEKGFGGIEDYVEAYKWCLLAEGVRTDITEIKSSLEGKMIPEQIAEAQKLAQALAVKIEERKLIFERIFSE